jgi:flagellar hook assembly protein FlgD
VYNLTSKAEVVLKVYNLRGQEVKTLVKEMQNPGNQSVLWDGTDNNSRIVSSGIYIYRLTAGKEQQSRKMLFLR